MLVAGAGGHARDLLEIFTQLGELDSLFFFDDTAEAKSKLFDRFTVLHSVEEVRKMFSAQDDHRFVLGTGNPKLRHNLMQKIQSAGGVLTTVKSPHANVGIFGTSIGAGANIMTGAVITNQVTIGAGCLVHYHASVAHDAVIGDFVEIQPGARISGNCSVGDFSVVGTNSSLLPGIRVGSQATIGAGAVVLNDVPSGATVVGVPAKVIRQISMPDHLS